MWKMNKNVNLLEQGTDVFHLRWCWPRDNQKKMSTLPADSRMTLKESHLLIGFCFLEKDPEDSFIDTYK